MTYKNSWLDDPEFIDNMQFSDKYYLQEYCKYISKFIRRLPVPLQAYWKPKTSSIKIQLGANETYLPVSSDIPVYEAGIMIDQWASQFYPQYEIEVESERPLTESEITIGIREGRFTLDEAFNQVKKVKTSEKGIIKRIHLVQDEFKLIVNGEASFRLSTILLSDFLKTLKTLKDRPEEIRAFIFDNSRLIRYESTKNDTMVQIAHSGNRMKNFFVIHREYLNESGMTQFKVTDTDDGLTYRSGKFLIRFESPFHRDSCLEILRQDNPKLILSH